MTQVVVFRDIVSDDDQVCTSRCPWRDEQSCTLFVTQLVPLSGELWETRCLRSEECKTAERSAGAWKQWKKRQMSERRP